MKIKTLLTSGLLLAATTAAMAFPDNYQVYPTPNQTYDDSYYLSNFNFTFASSATVEVAENAGASLECSETGDAINSESMYFYYGTLLVKFNQTEIVSNGEYTLIIEPDQFTVNGESNPKITLTYTLNDPALNMGEFPEIELVSVEPAEGSKLYEWGEAVGKVKFTTSDDAAVNYLRWTLYDVTGEEKEWISGGEKSRYYQLPAGGSSPDQWSDGIYFEPAGNAKMLQDHNYELEVRFCGIGYDPATDTYPSETMILGSTELIASIGYEGLTPGTEYSPYTVESVTPDYTTYVITDAENAHFTMTYSGPVKPVLFTYPLGMGAGTASAGTYTAIDPNEDGYASQWEYKFNAAALESAIGTLYVTTRAQDKDGLYVKGNKGLTLDDFDYGMEWTVTIGTNELSSVFPENFASVEQLNEIVVGNHPKEQPSGAGMIMHYSYLATEPARIIDKFGTEVRVLGEPETVSGDDTCMKWTFDAITDPGTYILCIPDLYFTFGEEYQSGGNSVQTFFTYVIENESEGEVSYDLEPIAVTPKDNATVESLETIVIEFAECTFDIMYPEYDYMSIPASLYRVFAGGEELVAEVRGEPDDFMNPTKFTYTFEQPVTEEGSYRFFIARGTYGDEEYDFSMYEAGHANGDLNYYYEISKTGAVESIDADASFDIFNVTGAVVKRNASREDLNKLPAGLYIINGKKIMIND